jgi:hypothetical protein
MLSVVALITRGIIGMPCEFFEQPVRESCMPEPVSTQQGGQRRPALSQAARVLDCRGLGLHSGQIDPVFHDDPDGTGDNKLVARYPGASA